MDRPVYGRRRKYANDPDTSSLLSQENKMCVEQVIRVFIYYARSVNLIILMALNLIAESQDSPTEKNFSRCTQLLDYLSWNSQAAIEYKSSDMKLWLHGYSAYLVSSKALSSIVGYLFLCHTPEKLSN